MSKTKILIVDDKQQNIEAAIDQFSSFDVELITVKGFGPVAELLKNGFDMVFTDLMMPAESDGIPGNHSEIGKEVPYGLLIAIMAKNAGVKTVAIMTDISHHSGPIPWAVNQIMGEKSCISCFGHKNYLVAAQKHLELSPKLSNEPLPFKKKKLLIIGATADYAKSLTQVFQMHGFKVKAVSEQFGVKEFIEYQPDFTLLFGEISGQMKSSPTISAYPGERRTLRSIWHFVILIKKRIPAFCWGFSYILYTSFLFAILWTIIIRFPQSTE